MDKRREELAYSFRRILLVHRPPLLQLRFRFSLDLKLSLTLLRTGTVMRKVWIHKEKFPVLGVKLGKPGRRCSPTGNILNNYSIMSQAGN